MRWLCLWLATASAWAQPAFTSLAPTADGSVLYFASPLRLKGSDEYPNQGKIFRWDREHGVQLYDQRIPTPRAVGPYFVSDTAYDLQAVSSSSDGKTVAVTGLADCNWGNGCIYGEERFQTTVRSGDSAATVYKGPGTLSANGRFALLDSPVVTPFPPRKMQIVDLASGSVQQVSDAVFGRHRVTDNGDVLVHVAGAPTPLVRSFSGVMTPLPLAGNVKVTADGNLFFHLTRTSAGRYVIQAVSPTKTSPLEIAEVEIDTSFDISDDGSVVVFSRTGQLWAAGNDGAGQVQLTRGPETVGEFAVSGSGRYVFAVTSTSRVVRLDLKTFSAEELIPATQMISSLAIQIGSVTAGSLARVVILSNQVPELRFISLFGHLFSILRQTPGEILVQTPFDLPEGVGWPYAPLRDQPDGPFEAAMMWSAPLVATKFTPLFYSVGGSAAALHEDFSAVVSTATPARPGEVVHLYGTGFGPVAPVPEVGQPAPATPLSYLTTPIECGLTRYLRVFIPGTIMFAGIAPGLIGTYQIDLRLPSPPAGEGTLAVYCRSADGTSVTTVALAVSGS